jgi:hypothetical protein
MLTTYRGGCSPPRNLKSHPIGDTEIPPQTGSQSSHTASYRITNGCSGNRHNTVLLRFIVCSLPREFSLRNCGDTQDSTPWIRRERDGTPCRRSRLSGSHGGCASGNLSACFWPQVDPGDRDRPGIGCSPPWCPARVLPSRGLGVQMICIAGVQPGGEHLLYHSHILIFRGSPGDALTN